MERQQQVASILSYVDAHRQDHASQMVCAKILGEKDRKIDDSMVGELHARLARAKQDVLDDCYHIIS